MNPQPLVIVYTCPECYTSVRCVYPYRDRDRVCPSAAQWYRYDDAAVNVRWYARGEHDYRCPHCGARMMSDWTESAAEPQM